MRTPRTSGEWHDLDRRHLLHPYTDVNTYATTGGRATDRAQHFYNYDTDGNEMAPFGGIKESGQIRDGSHYAMDDYLEIK